MIKFRNFPSEEYYKKKYIERRWWGDKKPKMIEDSITALNFLLNSSFYLTNTQVLDILVEGKYSMERIETQFPVTLKELVELGIIKQEGDKHTTTSKWDEIKPLYIAYKKHGYISADLTEKLEKISLN